MRAYTKGFWLQGVVDLFRKENSKNKGRVNNVPAFLVGLSILRLEFEQSNFESEDWADC